MTRTIEGNILAEGMRFGIVASRFNDFIGSRLIDGAIEALTMSGADMKDVDIIKVPGAFEIPLALKKLALSGRYDAIICTGAIIRGATPYSDYISSGVAKYAAKLALDMSIPIGFGMVIADTVEQAIERAGSKAGNKGWDAAVSAVEMVDLLRKLSCGPL